MKLIDNAGRLTFTENRFRSQNDTTFKQQNC